MKKINKKEEKFFVNGEEIYIGIKNKKTSTTELARDIEMSYFTITRLLYKPERKFRLSTIEKVCKKLDLDIKKIIIENE